MGLDQRGVGMTHEDAEADRAVCACRGQCRMSGLQEQSLRCAVEKECVRLRSRRGAVRGEERLCAC